MKSTLQAVAFAVLLMLTILLTGVGCSHDRSVSSPVSTTTAALVTESGGNEPTLVATFDDHINIGTWTFFEEPTNMFEHFDQQGGNPGDFLHCEWCRSKGGLTGRVVKLRTQIGTSSVFTGDYRARQVTRVGVDLGFFPYFPMQSDDRPLCLTLTNDNDTPADTTDDIVAIYKGVRDIPMDNGTWMKYEFSVPSESATLPDGWGICLGSGLGDDADWNTIITNVSSIGYVFGDLDKYWEYDFQLWDIGVDNARIWFEN